MEMGKQGSEVQKHSAETRNEVKRAKGKKAQTNNIYSSAGSSMEKNIQKSGSKDKQSSFGGNSIKQDFSTLPEIGHFYFALTK